jgi:S1-C subfamily serine protease
MNGTTNILTGSDNSMKFLGAAFRPLSDKEKNQYRIDGGVIVSEPGNGTFERQTNIHKGFVITGVNDMAVSSLNDLQQVFASGQDLQIGGFYPGVRGMYYYGLKNANANSGEE